MPYFISPGASQEEELHDVAELISAARLPDNGDLGVLQRALPRIAGSSTVIEGGDVLIDRALPHCPMGTSAKGRPCVTGCARAAFLCDLLVEISYVALCDAADRPMLERLAVIFEVALHFRVAARSHRLFALFDRVQFLVEVFDDELPKFILVLFLGLPAQIERVDLVCDMPCGNLRVVPRLACQDLLCRSDL